MSDDETPTPEEQKRLEAKAKRKAERDKGRIKPGEKADEAAVDADLEPEK